MSVCSSIRTVLRSLVVMGILSLPLWARPLASQAQPSADAPLTMPSMPLHDPWILADAATHTYFLYTSNRAELSGTPGVGTMVYRSTDLKHWQRPVAVFQASQGRWATNGGWAPEVHRWRGKYYLLTTLHDESKPLPAAANACRPTYRRGTFLAVSDTPMGPFRLVTPDAPLTPANFMSLDGTLYTDPSGKPWVVYAHEWLQKTDGTIEAAPLKDELSAESGDPVYLFKASDAPWLDTGVTPSISATNYVTDGPELFRTRTGHLLMLWSSYDRKGSYIQTVARSRTGTLQGPWEQLPPLVQGDSGHGMLFHTFDGHLMLVLHHPFKNARGRLYEVRDEGDHLSIVRERLDLDGAASEVR